jgi:FimV-like protein
MNAARAVGAMLLAGAALAALPWSQARAQAASAHEVRKGEGLYSIGGRFRYEGVTRFQVVVGIYLANKDAFPDGNINVLREGQVLRIPGRDEVAALSAPDAARQWQALTARPAPSPAAVASIKPSPPVRVPPGSSSESSLNAEAAAKRYRDGLTLERRGDHQGALTAFQEAGEAGDGKAQIKLGQIYDKGNTVVSRDYQTSLKWYQKAREQGFEIDKPIQRTTPR